VDEKDSILASVPIDLKEKGSTLYASLIDGKVCEVTLEEKGAILIYEKSVSTILLLLVDQLTERNLCYE
jgi:hypothetical protein